MTPADLGSHGGATFVAALLSALLFSLAFSAGGATFVAVSRQMVRHLPKVWSRRYCFRWHFQQLVRHLPHRRDGWRIFATTDLALFILLGFFGRWVANFRR